MQGAGSVVAANHIYNVSPKDGTELGLFAGNITIDPLMGSTQHKYDARKFNWIGAPSSDSNVCLSSPSSPFKTIDDVIAREMVTGTSGTSTYDFPVVLNNVIGREVQAGEGLCRQRRAAARHGARRDRRLLRRRLQFHARRRPRRWPRQHSGADRARQKPAHARRAVRDGLRQDARRIGRSSAWCSAGSISNGRSRRRRARRRIA